MDNLNKYGKLKSDIIALKEYIGERYGSDLNIRIDVLLTETNDLLLGIARGQLCMPYKELLLGATWSSLDGAYDFDDKLRELICKIQNDIYAVKKFIVVLAKYKWLISHKKINEINWLFPNLECKTGKLRCISYIDEDMLEIEFPNGYGIDLGFVKNDNVYVITIVKDDNWADIIEEHHIKLRSDVEELLQNLIYKYENL